MQTTQSINPPLQYSITPVPAAANFQPPSPSASLQHPEPTTPLLQHSIIPPDPTPWPEPVDGKSLLDELTQNFTRFVVLPKWAAEALALWVLHTYAFRWRDVSTYLGIESPIKRCGKTTLLELLNELAHRAVAAANISPPAFFRVIEELSPTLLIDEADTFLPGNEQLRGILNSGNRIKSGFVLRAANQPASWSSPLRGGQSGSDGEGWVRGNGSSETGTQDPESSIQHPASGIQNQGPPPSPTLHHSITPSPHSVPIARFSSWCPKAIATIGRLPDTLADRCIIIRMQRKTIQEECEPSSNLDAAPLRQKCKRFALDHGPEIAAARPARPEALNDRAADIWAPLLVLADLAGGDWPQKARQAAVSLSASGQETSPISSLLLDIFMHLTLAPEHRLFTRDLVAALNRGSAYRPWAESLNGKPVTDLWFAKQLRPYGIKSRTIWIGETHAKGFVQDDFLDTMRRYVSRSDYEAFKAEMSTPKRESETKNGQAEAQMPPTSDPEN